MSSFAARMLEAKRIKREARNRVLSTGDYRGTVRPRGAEFFDGFDLCSWREFEILRAFASDLSWIVAELNDANLYAEIPW